VTEARTSSSSEAVTRRLLGLVGLSGFAVALELAPRVGVLPAAYVPPTSTIVRALFRQFGRPEFWQALLDTLWTWLSGLTIAAVAGTALGVLIGSVPLLREATASTITFLRPVAAVALIPVVIVLVGTNVESIVILVSFGSFWQVLVHVLHGVTTVDPVAREAAHAYRLGFWYRMRYLVWTATVPYAIAGVRLATSLALVLAIAGEFVIGGPGLGRQIQVAQTSGAVAAMYALVLVTGFIGVAANVLTRSAERRVLRRHTSVRGRVPA
jgi:ABC-type nitrate/sulfonate/bicarbonate transport system permease component